MPGHKIGKPGPLFEKIDQIRLEELKKRYAGSQAAEPEKKQDSIQCIEKAEKAIVQQGNRTRAMKADKAEKTAVKEQV